MLKVVSSSKADRPCSRRAVFHSQIYAPGEQTFFGRAVKRSVPSPPSFICLRRHPLDTCLANYRQVFASTYL
jgi:hypothetical protein